VSVALRRTLLMTSGRERVGREALREADMSEQITGQPRATSRRALLAATAGSAAALAANAIAAPAAALAHDPDDVEKGVDNPTTTTTSITNSTAGTAQAPTLAFAGVSTGGTGVHGFSGDSGATPDDPLPGTGVFGSTLGADGVGVTGFGEFTLSMTTVGVFGSGDNGVIGEGTWGVVGVGHTGVQGLTTADDPGAVAVSAESAEINQYALQALGRVKLSLSGRLLVATGKSSVKVTLAGVTTGTHAFAQLGSRRSGTYIIAVVPTAGSFTVYLNRALTSPAYIHWFVLDA
jgi:hypothetical protein